MTLRQISKQYMNRLSGSYSRSEVDAIIFLAAEKILRKKKTELMLLNDSEISSDNSSILLQTLDRLELHEPLQYILSEADFAGMKLSVNKNVLIPRPETEELFYWLIESCRELVMNKPKMRILDIGTGSGCLAIGIKKKFPLAEVLGADISVSALEVARLNARTNHVEVEFLQHDILSGNSLNNSFDVIVSNPPYIKKSEQSTMHDNVFAYEPHLALFVDDDDDLLFYKIIGEFSRKHLSSNGLLFFEIPADSGNRIQQLLIDMNFREVEIRKDLQGKNRMIRCRLNI